MPAYTKDRKLVFLLAMLPVLFPSVISIKNTSIFCVAVFKEESKAEEGIEVDVPMLSNNQYLYKEGTTSHLSELDDYTLTVSTPPGKQLTVAVELEYKQEVYNYTLEWKRN